MSGRLRVSWQTGGQLRDSDFEQSFVIGRDADCQVRLDDPGVSKRHTEVYRSGSGWFVRDLGSANGTYLDDKPVKFAAIAGACTLTAGHAGPKLRLEPRAAAAHQPEAREPQQPKPGAPTSDRASVTQFIEDYLEGPATGETGAQGEVVRRAFARVQKKKARRYGRLMVAAGVMVLAALGFAAYQYQQTRNLRSVAIDIFYNMKSIEAQMHRLDSAIGASADSRQRAELGKSIAQVEQMSRRYDNFVEKVGGLDKGASETDRLILRVARMFGECELNAPDGFVDKVNEYITRWQQTKRLPNAIARAERQGYAPLIHEALVTRKLPPQFFYLALQESNFRSRAVGPQTRFGIAKGMWQFLPSTATQYGLEVGSMTENREYDAKDERFNMEKASVAAARYLSDIYGGEAQASGLLVMASYNWGHNRVRRLIRSMPDDPAKRNFWELINNHKVPQETYDYVFQIFSAAVIGEDPQLFGFDFDPPLTDLTYAWEGR